MDNKKRKETDAELDAFWQIEDLLPKKNPPVFSTDTSTVVVESAERKKEGTVPVTQGEAIPRAERDSSVRRFVPPHSADELSRGPKPIEEYAPENSLISSVRIFAWKNDYHYYETFVRDAVRLYPIRGEECPHVGFFSYVPQYSQLNRAQLEWYLWWRQCFRNGVYLDTDYTYLLLYIYELINLAGRIDPATAQENLCHLWSRYRSTYCQLDSYLADWICDYSFIHRLSPPKSLVGKDLAAVMSHCSIREFFVPTGSEEDYVKTLLAFCNNYDYKKSKFYTREGASAFDRFIPDVLHAVVRDEDCRKKLFSKDRQTTSTQTRDAFSGALCAYQNKRKIEVTYTSFSRSNELRFLITDIVKYTENQIRQRLGVRSRLSVYTLPNDVKEKIDSYLLAAYPPTKRCSAAVKKEVPEYEKLYDAPKKAFSLSDADEIEKRSWGTTEKLIEAFEDGDAEKEATAPIPVTAAAPVLAVETKENTPLLRYKVFLAAAIEKDQRKMKEIIRASGRMPDAYIDEVNQIAAESFGDILIEETEKGYAVLEDYETELEELLKEN